MGATCSRNQNQTTYTKMKNLKNSKINNMKTISIIILAVTFFTISNQVTGQKTLVKTISTQGTTSISLELEGIVTIKQWNQDNIRILMEVEHKNAHDRLMKYLIQKGRYNITSEVNGNTLVLSCAALNQPFVFGKKGIELPANIKYTTMVPMHTTVHNSSKELLATK